MKKNKIKIKILSILVILPLLSMVMVANSLHTLALNDTLSTDPSVVHLAKLRGISMDEARERIHWADKAARMNDVMTAKHNDSFGGVWVNSTTDRIMIGVVERTNGYQENREEIDRHIREYGLETVVDYAKVNNSFSRLLETRESISSILDNTITKGSRGYTVGIMTDQNKVLVRYPTGISKVSESEENIVQSIANEHRGVVKMEASTGGFEALSCNWWFCDSPLRGGVGIKGYASNAISPDGDLDCTAGFGVRGNSGAKYILTAGHCQTKPDPNLNYWRTSSSNYSNNNIGWEHRNVLVEGTEIDAMIIETSDLGLWSAVGKVYVRGGVGLGGFSGPSTNEEYDITNYATSSSLINQRVCVSGARSADLNNYEGGSCGPVKEIMLSKPDFGDEVGPLDGLVRAQLCSRPGDSGAPVFREGKALGILSGRISSSGIPPEGCSENIVYTGMQPILNAFNGTIEVY